MLTDRREGRIDPPEDARQGRRVGPRSAPDGRDGPDISRPSVGGSGAVGEPAGATARRTRLRDPDAIRRRAEAMLRRRLQGHTTRQIAAEFSVTGRHVRRALAALTEDDRRAVDRAWRDALLAPGAWKLLR